MAEDQSQDEKIFTSGQTEEESPSASNTSEEDADHKNTESGDSTETEENKEHLSLDEDKTKASENKRNQQVDSFVKKIITGKMSIDDLPKYQLWLKPHIEDKLLDQASAEKVSKEYDLDARLDEKLAERDDQRKFESLSSDLNDMKLTKKQKATIEDEWQDFRKNGMPRHKSLEKALLIAGVSVEDNARRRAMSMPSGTVGGGPEKVDYADKSFEDRIKRLKELTDSGA